MELEGKFGGGRMEVRGGLGGQGWGFRGERMRILGGKVRSWRGTFGGQGWELEGDF